MNTKEIFQANKEVLISFALRKQDAYKDMLEWVNARKSEGLTKNEIYQVFLELHKLIQSDIRTCNDKSIYDSFSDFLDGFTTWGKSFRILPDEPDIE